MSQDCSQVQLTENTTLGPSRCFALLCQYPLFATPAGPSGTGLLSKVIVIEVLSVDEDATQHNIGDEVKATTQTYHLICH